VQLVVQTC